jgi:hypothetical protein
MESNKMAEAISISTSKYIKTINVKIVEDGRVYRVRKIGAGEQLDMSALATEAQKVQLQVFNLRGRYEKAESEEEKSALISEIMETMKPLSEIQHKLEDIYIGLFDDGEGGKYSKNLVKALGIEKVQEVYQDIMKHMDGKTNEKSA